MKPAAPKPIRKPKTVIVLGLMPTRAMLPARRSTGDASNLLTAASSMANRISPIGCQAQDKRRLPGMTGAGLAPIFAGESVGVSNGKGDFRRGLLLGRGIVLSRSGRRHRC